MQRLEHKSTEVVDYPACVIVYICIRLVSRSHSADPKMAGLVNIWDLPIKNFLTLEK